MRTASIEIGGKAHLLCFSARVVRAVTERYGGMERIDEALSGKDGTDAEPSAVKALDEAVWLLAAMMDGGERYAKLNGLPNPHALTADELLDVMDIGDFARLREKLRRPSPMAKRPTWRRNRQKRGNHFGGPVTPEWFLWYGMRAGLSYREALDVPLASCWILWPLNRSSGRVSGLAAI